MTSAFTRQADRIVWLTSSGPCPLTEDAAEGLLSIFHEEHDALLREGMRKEARPLRGMILDLQEVLASRSQPSRDAQERSPEPRYFDGRSAA